MHILKKGVLIAIEGIDGSGKSSLAKSLYQEFLSMQYSVMLTKEPGGTLLGQQLRALVQEKKMPICPKAEFLLFATDRAQHFEEFVIPHLKEKKLIISDRGADSSVAYQGYGRGLDITTIKTINTWVMNGITPDITVYLKISADVAAQRVGARKIALTAFEKEKQDFFQKLITGFDTLYKNRNDVIIINGDQPQEDVTQQAMAELNKWIKQQLIQK